MYANGTWKWCGHLSDGDVMFVHGHSYDNWLLHRGGLLIQWNLYIVVTLETQPVGFYTEVVCLYSGICI